MIAFATLRCCAKPGNRYSFFITMIGTDDITMHRVLVLAIARDGSLYITLMKPDTAPWQVGFAPPVPEFLSRDVDTTKIVALGTTSPPKFTVHASGAVNFGEFRTYRPSLRALTVREQLCIIHYGNPRTLPALTMDQVNSWSALKKDQQRSIQPLLGGPLPGGVIATRVFVAPPSPIEEQQLGCSDFEVFQGNLVLSVRGLEECFPADASGEHGYDLTLSTGQWRGADWKGPLLVMPGTHPSYKPQPPT